ncbi:hypothetical protein [Paenibacillus radicis (ex Gao et al. 2016)]|uniref:Uncharacterized protein n=1 Tax=Paenibacillus radicis (ex Gao et al. 2016) TaxID=1737354 RepID=A0A917HBI3_9BACL|nr:hypothetical protein [Paenibacillus radicis (ex Gao et al. 2016)]GGG74015.1 hypothetical protein GCM10010918_32620 [Paenibacillus radicis (ex Gao et al. 2016)]
MAIQLSEAASQNSEPNFVAAGVLPLLESDSEPIFAVGEPRFASNEI